MDEDGRPVGPGRSARNLATGPVLLASSTRTVSMLTALITPMVSMPM
ncbi:hypothetical protein [Streptomyces sp. NPDC026589]